MERGIPVAEIARTVKCHRSTIYRELKRSGKTKLLS
ncbi:helix-turn-helix domain-containing protein [Shewanella japonica]